MALTERTEEDKIEILADGTMQIRTATVIERDGVEISRTYHRHVIQPGDDTAKQSPKVKGLAASAWTAEVKQKFKAAKAAREAKEGI
tara:strand:+ start:25234 stop:25494 length:261 start_codon:yes stop_codon:yes gene_type:complete